MAAPKQNLYQILGIDTDANELDVGLAYQRRNYELDRDGKTDDNSVALIRQAFEVLSDPKRRAAYDATLTTQKEKAAAQLQAQSPDLVLDGDDEEGGEKKNLLIPISAAVAIVAVGLYFVFKPAASPPQAAAPAEAPPPKPAPPPVLQPLSAEQILSNASFNAGQVLSYEMSGRAVPVGLAIAVEPNAVITTCHGIPPNSQLVVKVGKEANSATMTVSDEELDLCKFTVANLTVRPVTVAPEEARVGDKVFVLGANARGEFALTEGTVKNTKVAKSVKLLELTMPIAPNASGGPVYDVFGRLVGIATTAARPGVGNSDAISAGWLSQLRSRAQPQ
jgi:S1-C subfamily serine protease